MSDSTAPIAGLPWLMASAHSVKTTSISGKNVSESETKMSQSTIDNNFGMFSIVTYEERAALCGAMYKLLTLNRRWIARRNGKRTDWLYRQAFVNYEYRCLDLV